MGAKIYKAKIDAVFKMLFGDPKNKVILSDFLQAILGLSNDDVSEIDILNPFLRLEDVNGKLGILDVNLTTKSGKIIDIEMQVRKVASMRQRMLYYVSKLFSGQLGNSNPYGNLKKTIGILICTDHILIDENDKYKNKFLMRSEDSVVFTDVMEINTLELKKVPGVDDSKLAHWLRFLDMNDEEELDKMQIHGNVFKLAADELRRLSADKQTRIIIEAREKALKDEATLISENRQEAMKEGEEKGRTEQKIEIARNLLNMCISVEQIEKATGLSRKEIEDLRG